MPPPCTACLYLASNPKCDAEKQKGRGVPIAEIHRKYPDISYKTWKNHFNKKHRGRQKEAKIVNDLIMEAIDLKTKLEEVYALSIKAGKIAIGDLKATDPNVKPDLRSFGSCMMPAAKMVEKQYDIEIASKLQEEIDTLREQLAKDQ